MVVHKFPHEWRRILRQFPTSDPFYPKIAQALPVSDPSFVISIDLTDAELEMVEVAERGHKGEREIRSYTNPQTVEDWNTRLAQILEVRITAMREAGLNVETEEFVVTVVATLNAAWDYLYPEREAYMIDHFQQVRERDHRLAELVIATVKVVVNSKRQEK